MTDLFAAHPIAAGIVLYAVLIMIGLLSVTLSDRISKP